MTDPRSTTPAKKTNARSKHSLGSTVRPHGGPAPSENLQRSVLSEPIPTDGHTPSSPTDAVLVLPARRGSEDEAAIMEMATRYAHTAVPLPTSSSHTVVVTPDPLFPAKVPCTCDGVGDAANQFMTPAVVQVLSEPPSPSTPVPHIG